MWSRGGCSLRMVYHNQFRLARTELYILSGEKRGAALVIHLGALFLMLTVFQMNVYALVGSNIVFALVMCV